MESLVLVIMTLLAVGFYIGAAMAPSVGVTVVCVVVGTILATFTVIGVCCEVADS